MSSDLAWQPSLFEGADAQVRPDPAFTGLRRHELTEGAWVDVVPGWCDGADGLLGSWARVLRIEVFHTDTPFLLAMLPPGAFIGLGMMLAVKYLIDERMKRRAAKPVVVEASPEKAS